jgi:hypothetical protein
VPSVPLDAARGVVIATQARMIELLAAENARLAGQVADLATFGAFVFPDLAGVVVVHDHDTGTTTPSPASSTSYAAST